MPADDEVEVVTEDVSLGGRILGWTFYFFRLSGQARGELLIVKGAK